MKNFSVFGHTALMLKFLALLLLTLTFFACNKMEHREDAEESQIELFKKSVKSDTITVYEVDGIIWHCKQLVQRNICPTTLSL